MGRKSLVCTIGLFPMCGGTTVKVGWRVDFHFREINHQVTSRRLDSKEAKLPQIWKIV